MKDRRLTTICCPHPSCSSFEGAAQAVIAIVFAGEGCTNVGNVEMVLAIAFCLDAGVDEVMVSAAIEIGLGWRVVGRSTVRDWTRLVA